MHESVNEVDKNLNVLQQRK